MELNKNKILSLDIETTGFFGQGGSIIEIGIVDLDLDTGEITEVFDSLLREERLTEEHGEKPFGWIFQNSDLTLEEVMDAPLANEVFSKVQEVLDQYPLGCTAFNKKFDFGFLKDRGLKIKELP
ncbi:MAG: 3'-5' exonuclease [Candidatus Celaenobacter antarcticus]|nr:3'-5' exonuclease [Candidatus Celaenobacter antarcticus]